MALKRDTVDSHTYDALKRERYQLTQEIARLTIRNFDRDIGRLTRRVETIENQMRCLRETSPLLLK